MKINKELNLKLEFEIIGFERPENNNSGVIVNVKLNPPVLNSYNGELLDMIRVDGVVLNNKDTYEDILDKNHSSLSFDEYPLLRTMFDDVYGMMDFLYDSIIDYAKIHNLPLFFEDEEIRASEMTDKIIEKIQDGMLEGKLTDSDDFNDSYTILWKITNYALHIKNRYIEKSYHGINIDNIDEDNLCSTLYDFWKEWNEIIPGKFIWD